MSRWVTAAHALALGMVRAHNGVGWLWVLEGSDLQRACEKYTRAAYARGDTPPPPVTESPE